MKIWNTKVREIIVDGFTVEVHNFGYASFFYPKFNGNAEFKVTHDGFKKLRSYLKTVRWAQLNVKLYN